MRKKDEPGNHLSHVNGTYNEIQTGVQKAANEYYRRFERGGISGKSVSMCKTFTEFHCYMRQYVIYLF